jgi:hypothetical protein
LLETDLPGPISFSLPGLKYCPFVFVKKENNLTLNKDGLFSITVLRL